jgi:exopolysaccharide biosynthesis polyprenyl glycosylphosphotransferase
VQEEAAVLKERSRSVETALWLADLAALASSLPLAYLARDWARHGVNTYYSTDRLVVLGGATLAAWGLASWLFKVYDGYRTRPLSNELGRIARALATVALLAAAGSFVVRRFDVPRLLLVFYFLFASLQIVAVRVLVRGAAQSIRRRGLNTRRYAVVGSGDLAQEVVRSMATHPEWGFTLAGIILEHPSARAPEGLPVLGRLDEFGDLLERQVLDKVVFAIPTARLAIVEEAARLCQEQGVAVMVCLDLLANGIGHMTLSQLDGLPALTFSTVPSDPLALAAKRVFDVVVSAAVLLLFSPVLAAVALAIKLESPGPVLFRQRRVGLNGHEFFLYKFRSMQVDAEARLAALRARNELSGPVFKMTRDPRVTRTGQFIRRASLDEFPQFWNVLRGEMSVVGPRPPLPDEVKQYQRWQRRRLSMKPGITCTWQVSGRNEIDFDQWMRLDLHYIDNWSLWQDMEICLRTVPAVLSARGAS